MLVCFIYKKTFKSFLDLANYCDKCIYNLIDSSQIPDFELYNVNVRLVMIYEKTIVYSKFQLLAEYDCLYIINL